MKRFSFTVAAATTSGAAAVALAGIAAAAPTGGGNAGDATKELRAAGTQRADQRQPDRSVVHLRNHRRTWHSHYRGFAGSELWLSPVHDHLPRRLVS